MTKNNPGVRRPAGLGSGGTAPSSDLSTPGIMHDPNDPIATHHSYGMSPAPVKAPFIPGGPGVQFHDPGLDTAPSALESPVGIHHPIDPILPNSKGMGGMNPTPTADATSSLDWGMNANGDAQSRVNDIYAGPRAINPPPAPAQDLAGLAALKRTQARDSLGIGDMSGVGGHGKARVFESHLGL